MGYLVGLLAVLVAFWLAMSGLYKSLILSLGAASILITLILSVRLKVVDREGVPYFRLPAYLAYWAWLFLEIVKANWTVIQACLRADLDINPALVKVKTRCRTDLAKTTFANSITLTPGTVTLSVEGDMLLVHALYEEAAGPDAFDRMDRLSARAVDGVSA